MQVGAVQVNSRSRQSANAVGNTLTSLMQEESRCKRDYGAQQFATSTDGRVKKIQAANCVRASLRAQIRIRQAAYHHYMQLKDDVKPPHRTDDERPYDLCTRCKVNAWYSPLRSVDIALKGWHCPWSL